MIGNVEQDICHTPKRWGWNLAGRIVCPKKDANNRHAIWHSEIGAVWSPQRNVHLTGPCVKLNCGERFLRQWNPLLAAYVKGYPEYIKIGQVSHFPCSMSGIPKVAAKGAINQ
jgi:hypothetical protein